MRKTINLDDISIFVAVAEAGTFSAGGYTSSAPGCHNKQVSDPA
jgi:hypothetical protein